MKFYVVYWAQNGHIMNKIFKSKNSADLFAREMLEKIGNEIHISTFLGGVLMKFYVVYWVENGHIMNKIFKSKNSADLFAREMLEKIGNEILISTFLNDELMSTDKYN